MTLRFTARGTAHRLAVGALLGALAACDPMPRNDTQTPAPATATTHNTLSDAERAAGWRLLFDGRSMDAWRGYNRADVPAGWQVVDGTLARVAEGGDLVTREQYANFELALEWRVQAGGNSGVFYRGVELPDQPIYVTAPEMQVLDDERHRDGQSPLTSAGAVYGLYPAPRGIVRPAGEWNAARVVVNGNHVEHWLNGSQVATYELGSADWAQRVAAAKFREWPGYGKAARGYIGLQDHGDPVAFRNIRIRVLP